MGYQLRMFWFTNVKPFIDPFADIAHHTGVKIIVGVLWIVGALSQVAEPLEEITTVFGELLTMPPKLWVGLNLLIFGDFVAGSIRALADPKIRFRMHRWVRTAYKFSAYNGACITIAVAVNMFPQTWENLMLIQYVVYGLLAGQEVVSSFRNMKLISLLEAIWDVLKKGKVDIQAIVEKWERNSRKEYREHEKKYKMSIKEEEDAE